MTPEEELARLVLAMRNHQKAFAKHKSGHAAKDIAERAVDNAVAAILASPGLFPEKIAGRPERMPPGSGGEP